MTLNLTVPVHSHTDFRPRITVIGVGGGGTNAVDNMIALNLQGVDFVVANTDAQQLVHSRADRRVQLGPHLTQGLGAGAKPEIGRRGGGGGGGRAEPPLEGTHMVFITAGMGGGTGTGAAPVIARMARERGRAHGGRRHQAVHLRGWPPCQVRRGGHRRAAAATWIPLSSSRTRTCSASPNERTGWKEAFKMADHVLYMGVRGVTDLMMAPRPGEPGPSPTSAPSWRRWARP